VRLVQTNVAANGTLNMLVNSSVHIEKFIEFENNKLVIDTKYYSIEKKLNKAVQLENIDFKYFNSDEYIFKNLKLSIEKNKHTVITGPNGSGKSTLLGLISQVFYPESGSINVFTNKVGYVGVLPLIIDGTLRENLIYGSKNKIIEDSELYEILKVFKLFDSDNYDLDYQVSNRTLSSGQMQKISFMRSLLADTELLLLDESTSNLDTATRELIFDILSKKGLTIINSTHSHLEFNYDNHIKIEYVDDKRTFLS